MLRIFPKNLAITSGVEFYKYEFCAYKEICAESRIEPVLGGLAWNEFVYNISVCQ